MQKLASGNRLFTYHHAMYKSLGNLPHTYFCGAHQMPLQALRLLVTTGLDPRENEVNPVEDFRIEVLAGDSWSAQL